MMASTPNWFVLLAILLSWGCSPRHGVIDFGDGRYTGDFDKDGLRHGQGLYEWNSGDRYEGTFNGGKRHGKGLFVWSNGDRYEGDYHNGKRHGRGSYVWSTGARYDGQYSVSKRNGRGVFTDVDSSRYEGWWQDDLEHGHGILSYPDGRRVEDVWILGRRKTDKEDLTHATNPKEDNATVVATLPKPEPTNPVTTNPPSRPGSTSKVDSSEILPPLPGETVEILPTQPTPQQPEETPDSHWKGTEEEAKAHFKSRELEGNVTTLDVKETGEPFEGTITIFRENGRKQGQVTVVKGLLHGVEIVWDENGEVIERNLYENGILIEEKTTTPIQKD